MAHFLATVERDAVSVVAGNSVLSSANIARLSAMLAPSPLPDDPPQPPLRERRPKIIRIINDRRNNIRRCYKGLLEMADAALRKYAHQTGEQYELHTIYGETFRKDYEEFHVYVRMNFMASSSSYKALQAPQPVCFFAEALRPPRPGYHEDDITLCSIVQPSPTDIDSCHGSLANNHRIDHPEAGMHFIGKHNKMDGSDYDWDWPHTADVSYRFFDPDRDVGLVEHLYKVITRFSALCGGSTDEDDNEDITR
uniref:DUF3615 domain-containing protein n=1 Tax=Oryza glumipatula TaxID=40148 RepID=A0A0D9Y7H6_9ORYZ